MATILTEAGAYEALSAKHSGDALWLSAEDAEAATGWLLKPEGLCRDNLCTPAPKDDEENYVAGSKVNIAAFWRLMNKPVVHDNSGETWMLGAGHEDRSRGLKSLEAPNFSLPDLNGDMHALSDYRGKRVFLTTWSSW